jgi:hypothetical protein
LAEEAEAAEAFGRGGLGADRRLMEKMIDLAVGGDGG